MCHFSPFLESSLCEKSISPEATKDPGKANRKRSWEGGSLRESPKS